MDLRHEIIVDSEPIIPDRLLGHVDLYYDTEVLGPRQASARREGGISFGRLEVTRIEPQSYRPSEIDRVFILVRFPFDLDRLPNGHRYVRVDFNVELADADAIARSIWPVLVTDEREADLARAFTIGTNLDFTSHGILGSTGSRMPVVRYINLQPSIVGAGEGRSTFSWTLEPTQRYPLVPASRSVFAILDLPKELTGIIGTLSANAEIGRQLLGEFRRTELRSRQLPFGATLHPVDGASSDSLLKTGRSVFISYAYDSREHVEQVVELANLLSRHGFDVIFDQWSDGRRLDWSTWMTKNITESDFVVIVVSPDYRRAGDGLGEPAVNRGVQAETTLMREFLHRDRREWTPRLLPVLLPGHEVDEIPLFLQPYTGDRYSVTELSTTGIAGLLKVLIGQPTAVRPP